MTDSRRAPPLPVFNSAVAMSPTGISLFWNIDVTHETVTVTVARMASPGRAIANRTDAKPYRLATIRNSAYGTGPLKPGGFVCFERVIRRHRRPDSQASLPYSSNQLRPEITFAATSNFTPSGPHTWNGGLTANGTDCAPSRFTAH